MKKRILGFVLVLCMSIMLMQLTAFAGATIRYNEYTATYCVGEEFSVSLSCYGTFVTVGGVHAKTTDSSIVKIKSQQKSSSASGSPVTANCQAVGVGETAVSAECSSISGGFSGIPKTYTITSTRYTITVISSTRTVTFNPNGGSCTTSVGQVEYNQPYGYYMQQLPTPTWKGHSFDGWYTAATGGTRVTATDVYTIRGDQTLYAHWSLAQYPVFFDASGGTTPVEYKYVTYGSTYGELPTPAYDGYDFTGWYDRSQYGFKITEDTAVTIEDEQVLYAHWTASSYTVTFDANGGSTPTQSMNVTYGSTYGTLPTPVYAGHTFAGWFTEPSGGTQITSSSAVSITSNQVLYAIWEMNNYTVSYNLNGADGTIASQTYEYGTNAYISSEKPTRKGYKFLGWARMENAADAEFQPSDVYTENSDITLYAVWKGLPSTETSIIKKSAYSLISIRVKNAEIGNKIIIATYNNSKLSDLQIEPYEGEDVGVVTFLPYDTVKVMIWESLESMIPLCRSEIITQQ